MKHANDNLHRCKTIPIPPLRDYEIFSFWRAVDRSGGPDSCWPWMLGKTAKGHGRVKIQGRLYGANRVAYTIEHGPIVDRDENHGTVIRHSCDNPPCCNPAHLIDGSQWQNCRDMVERDRAKPQRGEANPGAKITSETARLIRSSPLSERKMAAQVGLCPTSIRKIRNGERWVEAA